MITMFADTLVAVGLKRREYVITLNSRKLLDGVLEASGVAPNNFELRSAVLRALDKLDRLSVDGVAELLGRGRKDESGAFTKGAGLSDSAITRLFNFTGWPNPTPPPSNRLNRHAVPLANLQEYAGGGNVGAEGVAELKAIQELVSRLGYLEDKVLRAPATIRGLN